VRATANRLRAVVKPPCRRRSSASGPVALIGYDLPIRRRGVYFAWVWPEREHVHLGFQHGIFMDDPDRMLQGAHLKLKKVRYVTVDPARTSRRRRSSELTRHAADIAALPPAARTALLLDRD
jgi:hypothetical protein